jgi:hypothetical protein
VCRRDHSELEHRLAWIRRSAPVLASMSTEALAETRHVTRNSVDRSGSGAVLMVNL